MGGSVSRAREAEVLRGVEADPVDAAGVPGVEGEELARVDAPHPGSLVGRGRGQEGVTQPGQTHVPQPVLVTDVLLLL